MTKLSLLGKSICLFLSLLASSLSAAPPKLNIPQEIRNSGQYAIHSPETDAVSVVYIGLDGVEPLPSNLLRDGKIFVLDTRGLADGRYRFVAVAASSSGEQIRQDFTLLVQKNPAQPSNPPTNPPTNPPANPPVEPNPSDRLWLLVVQPDGPVSPELAQYLRHEVWEWVSRRGVATTRREISQLRSDLTELIRGATLPTVVILREKKSGNESYSEVVQVFASLPEPEQLRRRVEELLKP